MTFTAPTTMAVSERLDFRDIELKEFIGRGGFGVVYRAVWHDKNVAVKIIDFKSEKQTIVLEASYLARLHHENIILFYGTFADESKRCLVMEYAECGSLHNLLHGQEKPSYTAAHALSWALQCAKGVEYLHGLSPPVIHRDLKPANLLLTDCGRKIKICDFGTACDLRSFMSNNQGSAAWMAPEVFQSNRYNEKCDVYSWSMILWEVLSRRIPFHELGGPALRIMWAVHLNRRPPKLSRCPTPLLALMKRCWSAEASSRLDFTRIVAVMTAVMKFFKGADTPVLKPPEAFQDERNVGDFARDRLAEKLVDESTLVPSVDFPWPMTRRRSSLDMLQKIPAVNRPACGSLPNLFAPEQQVTSEVKETSVPNSSSPEFLGLEPDLRPIPPLPSCEESVEVFHHQCVMARELLKIREEVSALQQRKGTLLHELDQYLREEFHRKRLLDHYDKLRLEKLKLITCRNELYRQLQYLRNVRKIN